MHLIRQFARSVDLLAGKCRHNLEQDNDVVLFES
jgi:hypothetical protein